MDQNQQTVDNDLQKAIDDITNTTNTDPVFSDPVAAPSSVPENDTGELGDPIGPFPAQGVEMPPLTPNKISPFNTATVPELNPTGNTPEQAQPAIYPTPQASPSPLNNPAIPEPPRPPVPDLPEPPAPDISTSSFATPPSTPENLNTAQIKTAALRDLAPLMNKLPLEASQKFGLYRDIIEDLDDKTVLGPAYETARDIPDEIERAKALLYLVESIDKM